MLQRFTSRLPAIAMAGLLILGLSPRAHADLRVTLKALTPSAASASAGPVSGNTDINFNLTSGIFSSNGTGHGEASSVVSQPGAMDLSTVSVSSTGAGTVELVFSMNNITSPVGPGTITETITAHVVQAGSATVDVTYSTKGDNTNFLYDGTLPSSPFQASLGPISVPHSGTSASASGAFTALSPYSLTEVLILTFHGSGKVSLSSDSSAQFQAVPEPSSMAMAGLGALGIIGYGLRRRKAMGA
jgi:hypothetical protein